MFIIQIPGWFIGLNLIESMQSIVGHTIDDMNTFAFIISETQILTNVYDYESQFLSFLNCFSIVFMISIDLKINLL